MEIYRSTSPTNELRHGKLMVGLAPAPLSLVAPGVILNKINAARGIMVRNMSSSVVYVGGENVSTQTGFPISPSAVIIVPVNDPEFLYLVAEDADCECRWILV